MPGRLQMSSAYLDEVRCELVLVRANEGDGCACVASSACTSAREVRQTIWQPDKVKSRQRVLCNIYALYVAADTCA